MDMTGHVPTPTPFAVSFAISHASKPIAKLRLTLPPARRQME